MLQNGMCSGPDLVAPGPTLLNKDSGVEQPQVQGEPIGHYLHANKEALSRQTFQNAFKLERAFWKYAADNNGAFSMERARQDPWPGPSNPFQQKAGKSSPKI